MHAPRLLILTMLPLSGLGLLAGCGGGSAHRTGAVASARPAGPTATASSTAVPDTPLAAVLPTAAQVSAAHHEQVDEGLQPSGTSLTVATLDLCAGTPQTYGPSERLRDQRIQVDYTDPATSPPQRAASVEVVRYRTGGTALAFSELTKAVSSCPPSIHVEPSSSTSTNQELTVTRRIQNNLGAWVYETDVYQFQGDLFGGLYLFAGTMDDSVQAANALAGVLAANLNKAAAHL